MRGLRFLLSAKFSTYISGISILVCLFFLSLFIADSALSSCTKVSYLTAIIYPRLKRNEKILHKLFFYPRPENWGTGIELNQAP